LLLADCVAVPREIGTNSHPPAMFEFLPENAWVRFKDDGDGTRHTRVAEIPNLLRRFDEIDVVGLGEDGRASLLRRIPMYLHEDIAYLCGLIASDGCFARNSRTMSFVNREMALHDRVREVCETCFAYTPRLHLNRKRYDLL